MASWHDRKRNKIFIIVPVSMKPGHIQKITIKLANKCPKNEVSKETFISVNNIKSGRNRKKTKLLRKEERE